MKGTSPWANIFEEISIIPTFLHSPSLKLQWKGLNGQLFLLLANMHKAWNRLISLHSFLLNFLKIVVSFERRYFFHAEHNIFIIFSSLSYCYLLRDFCWAGGNQPNSEIFFFYIKLKSLLGKVINTICKFFFRGEVWKNWKLSDRHKAYCFNHVDCPEYFVNKSMYI